MKKLLLLTLSAVMLMISCGDEPEIDITKSLNKTVWETTDSYTENGITLKEISTLTFTKTEAVIFIQYFTNNIFDESETQTGLYTYKNHSGEIISEGLDDGEPMLFALPFDIRKDKLYLFEDESKEEEFATIFTRIK